MGTAKLLKDNLPGFTGHAALYELTPPMILTDWDDKPKGFTKWVVVSATVAMCLGPETYIFPAYKNGKIKNWVELEGSYRGGLSHAEALEGAGYELIGDQ